MDFSTDFALGLEILLALVVYYCLARFALDSRFDALVALAAKPTAVPTDGADVPLSQSEDRDSVTLITLSDSASAATATTFARLRKDRIRARAWLLSLVVSAVLSLLGAAYAASILDVFTSTGGSAKAAYALLRQRDAVGRVLTIGFMSFCAADLAIGYVDYRSQVSFLDGWLHHLVYFGTLAVFLREGYDGVFAYFGLCELPTFMLALGSVYKPWRIDLPMGIIFFATRIVYFGGVVMVIAINEHISFRSTLGSALMCLHVYWFVGWIKSYRRLRAARSGDYLSSSREERVP